MTITLEDAIATLDELDLAPAAEVHDLLARIPEEERPADGAGLLEELTRRGRLTDYQSQALRARPPQPLVLSNYLLLELLGAGGMGRVFKALHRRMDRLVALKVLHERAVESQEAIERFHREVKAAARLQHPHIVAAYDAGEDRGLHFLVMEYVEGRDLATLAQHGPLPLADAIRYAAQAARGLEYAHGRGVVHRDIKPANLLLSNEGVVKILDMGIARIAADEISGHDATQAELTQAGAILGTVDFLAPEQAIDSKSADHRADVYSLGCTLCFLLTGAPLHSGKTVIEKIIAHREREAPSLRTLRPDAPAELEELVRGMTAKSPEERIATMGEVAAALESLLERGDPAWSARPDAAAGARLIAPDDFASPNTTNLEAAAETLAGSETNPAEVLERFVDGCAGVDGYFDVEEEHTIFRKGGELGLSLESMTAILDRRCEAHGWTRHSALTARLQEMLEKLARDDGAIDEREFDRLIRHAVQHGMPRRQAEEHCLTLMLNHRWRPKERFWRRWFARRCRKYGLE